MRFLYYTHENTTVFEAIVENVDEMDGLRAQGPYTLLELDDNKLILNYVSKKKLHPDIVAAICISAFYPFIKYTATMPEPVSPAFAAALQMDFLPAHTLQDGVYRALCPITITNIDTTVLPYKGSNTVITYGGGADSTACALLYPEFPLIHMTNTYKPTSAVKNFAKTKLPNTYVEVASNIWSITKPGGFPCWTSIFVAPLLFSADMDIGSISSGAMLASVCMANGHKYMDGFQKRKSMGRWYDFYQKIGITIFSVVAGCSELITSKIVVKNNLELDTLFCESNAGKPCFKCTKCLRKCLTFEYNGVQLPENIWSNFQNEKIYSYLKQRPLMFAVEFLESIKHSKTVPPVLVDCVKDIIDTKTDVFTRAYTKVNFSFPEAVQGSFTERIGPYCDIMSPVDEFYLESWDMTK